MAAVNQVKLVASPFAKATENHFVKRHVLFGRHFSAGFVDRILPGFLTANLFEDSKWIRLHGRTGLFGKFSTHGAPCVFKR